MLPENCLRSVYEYFEKENDVAPEVRRAIEEFFDVNFFRGDGLPGDVEDPFVEGLFHEWFVYDFRLSTGESPLAWIARVRPRGIAPAFFSIYEQILQTSFYSLFEVEGFVPEKEISLRDVLTDQLHVVSERSGTRGLRTRLVLFGRIAVVDGVKQMIGANGLAFPVAFGKEFRRSLQSERPTFGPKDVLAFYRSNPAEEQESSRSRIDPDEARCAFSGLLERYDLAQMVTEEGLRDWMFSVEHGEMLTLLSVLVGLLPDDAEREDAEEVVQAFLDWYHVAPQKALDGKSPQEAEEAKRGRVDAPSGATLEKTLLGSFRWNEPYSEAIEALRRQDAARAVDLLEETFRILAEDKTTPREPYRLFANLAVAHLANDDVPRARACMDIANGYNANYDFGRMVNAQVLLACVRDRLETFPWEEDMLEGTPTGEILEQLEAVGVLATEESFRKEAVKFVDEKRFVEAYWDPLHTGPDATEDLLLVAARRLYERWLPDHVTIQSLYRDAYDFLDAVEAREEEESGMDGWEEVGGACARLMERCEAAPEGVMDAWKDAFESYLFEPLADACVFLGATPVRQSAAGLAEALRKRGCWYPDMDESDGEADDDAAADGRDEADLESTLAELTEKHIQSDLRGTDALAFYEFMKRFPINFSTEETATTPFLTAYQPKGPGRNAACPCGAAKDDGKAKKYKQCCGK